MRGFKRILRLTHLWLALITALPLIAIGVSGSALIVQREVVALSAPRASSSMPAKALVAILATAQSAVPAGAVATRMELPQARALAVVNFDVTRRPQRRAEVLVDPASLDIVATGELLRRGPVKQFLTDIHEFLMLPDHIGFPLVGVLGVVMTFLGLSGLVLWWPRQGAWRRAFTVRRGAQGLAFHADWHHALGIWGALVLLVLAISGVYLIFPRPITDAVHAMLPFAAPAATHADLPGTGPVDADGAVAIASRLITDGVPRALQLPVARNAPFVVEVERTTGFVRFPRVMVSVDPATGSVTYVDDPRDHALAERAINLLYAGHFALGLGWVWTLLVFLGGLLPLALAITGTMMWWLRRRVAPARVTAESR
jgi:uncharacterized iron-regulated membrane protein